MPIPKSQSISEHVAHLEKSVAPRKSPKQTSFRHSAELSVPDQLLSLSSPDPFGRVLGLMEQCPPPPLLKMKLLPLQNAPVNLADQPCIIRSGSAGAQPAWPQ